MGIEHERSFKEAEPVFYTSLTFYYAEPIYPKMEVVDSRISPEDFAREARSSDGDTPG